MISFSGAVFLVIGFIILIKKFSLLEKTTDAVSITKLALADMRNSELNDDAKEFAMQQHAKRLFSLFFLLTLGGAAAVLLPAGFLWLLEQIDMISFDAVIATALSLKFLLASTVASIAYFALAHKHQS